jgi:Tol biopolymer transport system component
VLTERGIYPSALLNDTTLLALRWLPTQTGGDVEYTWRAYAVRIPASGSPADPGTVVATPLIDDGGNHLFPDPSPDGEWISYTSNASGPFEVYVIRASLTGRPIRVSRGGGELGTWSRDGARLYYRNGREWLYVDRTGRDDEPFTEPRLFVSGSFHNVAGRDHAVSPDGRRLLLVEGPPDESATVLHVTTNWFEELRQLVPAD